MIGNISDLKEELEDASEATFKEISTKIKNLKKSAFNLTKKIRVVDLTIKSIKTPLLSEEAMPNRPLSPEIEQKVTQLLTERIELNKKLKAIKRKIVHIKTSINKVPVHKKALVVKRIQILKKTSKKLEKIIETKTQKIEQLKTNVKHVVIQRVATTEE